MEPPQKKTSGPVITDEGTTQTLVLSGPPDDQSHDENDPFTSTNTEGGSEFCPVEVGRSALTGLHRSEVMVKEWGTPIGNQYYRSVMPDFPISLCGSCNKVSCSSFPTHLHGLDIHSIMQGPL
ncbi:Intraflagellar transport protein 122 homolog [Geodia barretti]|uniref:Intraflagellar transport protein 122 homolog n=1 Tax=Geodia barretti TaxID=519541 RepID=A0AA35XLB3_GEOBA|nr:Intraflagellar transport protein 122 homolog [Geodia barretti]